MLLKIYWYLFYIFLWNLRIPRKPDIRKSGGFLADIRWIFGYPVRCFKPLLGTETWQVSQAGYFIRGKLFLIIIQPIQFLSLMNVLVGIRSGFPLPPNPELLPSLFLHSQVTLKSGECFGRVLVSALLSILPLHLPFPRLTRPLRPETTNITGNNRKTINIMKK